ncbi:MAG: acyltransferase, partial [Culicoidibacterales bacterium]
MRKSNFELLRIVSMVMVVTLHVLLFTGAQKTTGTNFYFAHFLKSCSIGAVTLFVLITGYFSTSLKEIPIKKLKVIWKQIAFYAIGIALILLIVNPSIFSVNTIIKTFLPIISMNYWFISAYLVLMCLAPYINKLLMQLTKQEFTVLVLIIVAIGFIWTTLSIIPGIEPIVKDNGYGIASVVMWYIFGAYLKLYSHEVKINKYWYLLGYLSFSAMIFLSIVVSNLVIGRPIGFFYGYNNILVLGAAVSLFLFFERLDFTNAMINQVAGLTLGVYLIHEHTLFRQTIYQMLDWNFTTMNSFQFLGFIFGFVAIIFISCAVIEKLRQLLFMRM